MPWPQTSLLVSGFFHNPLIGIPASSPSLLIHSGHFCQVHFCRIDLLSSLFLRKITNKPSASWEHKIESTHLGIQGFRQKELSNVTPTFQTHTALIKLCYSIHCPPHTFLLLISYFLSCEPIIRVGDSSSCPKPPVCCARAKCNPDSSFILELEAIGFLIPSASRPSASLKELLVWL